jgi:hypothetical protein
MHESSEPTGSKDHLVYSINISGSVAQDCLSPSLTSFISFDTNHLHIFGGSQDLLLLPNVSSYTAHILIA